MANNKNKIKIKNLNENSLSSFGGYKEGKIIKSAPPLKALEIEPKSEKLKELSSQIGDTAGTDKAANKPAENGKGISKDDSSLSLGMFLQEARVKAGYSISQIAIITKLNINYIEALERDDLKHTPPLIYIKAYIKKLSSIYKIDTEKALNLLKTFDSNTDKKISNSIFQELQETKQNNTEDEEKIKIIFKISAIVFLVIVTFGCIVGLLFWFSNSDFDAAGKPLTASEKAATIKSMEKLVVPQSISLTELPIKLKKK